MQIHKLTRSEADYLQLVCNFTEDENALFELRLSGKNSLEDCAEKMNVSTATISRIHKSVLEKIEKEY